MFYGRNKELELLNNKYNSNRKELGVLYGRRRIGKTELLKAFIENKNGLLFQAKKASSYENLKSFSYAINKFIGEKRPFVYESYEMAFDVFLEFVSEKRFVLIIDEYPYILDQNSSFSSVLQEFVDNMPDNIMVILSGSDVSFLKEEITKHNSPLYKRRTFEIELRKMPFDEALKMLDGFDFEDKCKYLSLLSTYPYYLNALDKERTFDENVINLIFNQYGTFFSLPDQLLSNSTNIQDVYNSILEAIALRKRSIKDISLYIKEEGAKVSKYLSILLNNELVTKNEMFDGNQKNNYYEIADPLLRFWYTFIFQNEERIKTNGKIVYQSLSEQINVFLSKGMENVARSYIDYLNSKGRLKDVFSPLKEYKVEKSKLNRSVEIDGLSKNEKYLLVMECKFRNKEFSKEMFEHLEESVSIFPDKLIRDYYIFSKNGFSKELKETDNLHLIDFKDIIK